MVSLYVAQPGNEFIILPPQPPKVFGFTSLSHQGWLLIFLKTHEKRTMAHQTVNMRSLGSQVTCQGHTVRSGDFVGNRASPRRGRLSDGRLTCWREPLEVTVKCSPWVKLAATCLWLQFKGQHELTQVTKDHSSSVALPALLVQLSLPTLL